MSERLDLSRRYRDQIEALLREHVPGVEVWAYGSRVSGRSHKGSDLDLVLRGPGLKQIPSGQLMDLIEALEESNVPIIVQTHDWASLPERFHREIEREYVVLVEGEWCKGTLDDVIDLVLSSVDKKTKDNECAVQLCNYTDVYYNSFIHASLDFMTATATDREIAKCSLFSGDVVITKDSEKHDDIGVPALVREDIPGLVCGYHLAILRPVPSKIEGNYLFYALCTSEVQHQFHSYANGITRFGLRKADIGLVEIPLPSLPEQRAIAHILGTLDDKIELNRRMNETLEEMARALFKSWFVDFDPVRAKMEGRDTGMPPDVADLFPNRLVDSELGEIPEGWEVKTVGTIASIVGGTTPSTKQVQYWEGGTHCWATPKDLASLSVPVLLKTERKITDAGLGKIGSGLLPPGTVLLSSRAPIGYLAVAEIPVAINQGFIGILPHDEISNLFMLYWSEASHDEIINHANGSTFLEISKSNFRQLPVVVPDEPAMKKFDDLARPLYNRIVSNERQSRTLSSLRDALLPKLISGEMRVNTRDEESEAIGKPQ